MEQKARRERAKIDENKRKICCKGKDVRRVKNIRKRKLLCSCDYIFQNVRKKGAGAAKMIMYIHIYGLQGRRFPSLKTSLKIS